MGNLYPLRKTRELPEQVGTFDAGNGTCVDVSYAIVRSAKRRRISIEVCAGKVVVRAPQGVADTILLAFLQQKIMWVVRKVAEQQLVLQQAPTQDAVPLYAPGLVLPLMDSTLCLVVGMGPRAAVHRVDDQLHVLLSTRSALVSSSMREAHIKRLVVRWYQQHALQVLTHKTRVLAESLGLTCTQVTVKATRSKWGHCTVSGAIQYNWLILLAPEAVVDYLVAHEVSHLRHHNHSDRFWALVESVCPDFKQQRAWLKQHGAQLTV